MILLDSRLTRPSPAFVHAVLRIIPTSVQTVHRNTRKPASLLDSQFLNLSRDGVAAKPQTLRSFDPATVQHVERCSNDRSLEVGEEFGPYATLSRRKLRRHEFLQKSRPIAIGCFRRRADRPCRCILGRLPDFLGKVLDTYLDGGRHHEKPSAEILKLSDIAGKAKRLQTRKCLRRQALRLHAKRPRLGAQEVFGQRRNVLRTFTQGRKTQPNHVQTMIEVLSKEAVLYTLLQILIGGGDDADVALIG